MNTAAAASETNDTTDQSAANELADVQTSHSVTAAEAAALAATDAGDDGTTTADLAAANEAAAAGDDATAAAAATDAAAVTAAASTAAAVSAATSSAIAAAAPTGPQLLDIPPPPKDFDAERLALTERYNANDIDDDAHDAAERALNNEQARYEGTVGAIEAQNTIRTNEFAAQASKSFDDATAAWKTANAEFCSNPIRFNALQQAINIVDTETRGVLSADALLERASKIAFEAYSWDPAAHGAPAKPDNAAATAAALAARQPNVTGVPRTLGDAPTAGNDTQGNRFAHLENASVQEMERAVAGMTPAQQDAWLMEVDGDIR